MKMTVVGTQINDYISKKTGQPVKGISLYCTYKDQAVDGLMVDSVYVSDKLDCYPAIVRLPVGSLVDVEYNKRGYVANVFPLQQDPAGKK